MAIAAVMMSLRALGQPRVAPGPAPEAIERAAPEAIKSRPSVPLSINEQDEDYVMEVTVEGVRRSSGRGLLDYRVKRELLEASPRMRTSELLSAAPGFFVDHEDGEGLGNDVHLRGFDLEHGSGIEMRIGAIPINIPMHVRGQGYADVDFIIPELVRSIRVLGGPYDPRQGDAAIVGSAYFDLGVPERGYQLKGSYGSFDQARVVAVAAPALADEATFAAFSLRKTEGFGVRRASQSGSAMAQYGVDLGPNDRVQFLATAYGARALSPGVVRTDDVDAGRVGYDQAYPYFAENQGARSSRIILGADFDHMAPGGAHFELAPWFMLTHFRARQNYAGNLESSQIDPALFGFGDLFETTNQETAFGATSRYRAAPVKLGRHVDVLAEPGIYVRGGHGQKTKSLLVPDTLAAWDRRVWARLDTLDVGIYGDLDVRLFDRVRLSGGIRADLLLASIDDRLANAASVPGESPIVLPGGRRDVAGVALSPRATLELELLPSLSPVVSYGEGFRSLDAGHLPDGATRPYSKVRSFEAGLRATVEGGRYAATIAAFETRVGNELVFEATTGGYTTQNASTRRGVISSLVAEPFPWLLTSTALSVTNATFATRVAGVAHYVPNVPPVVFRGDVALRGRLGDLAQKPIQGRLGAGYTFLAGRHLTDAIRGPVNHVVNVGASLRCGGLELGVEAYNVLGLRYADDAEVYVSNWSQKPGQEPASVGTHVTAAPPRSVLATLAVYF